MCCELRGGEYPVQYSKINRLVPVVGHHGMMTRLISK